jgi:hypothetical protein
MEAPTNNQGYIPFHFAGRPAFVHRIVWQHHKNNNQPIPTGMHVRHMCNNRQCVKPDHLEIGTATENARDKVTEADKERARVIYASRGSGTQKQRAARFGVTLCIVKSIDSGVSWAQYSGYSGPSKKRKFGDPPSAHALEEARKGEQARVIYESRDSGTKKERAERFGVPYKVIQRIDSGLLWSRFTGHKATNKKLKKDDSSVATQVEDSDYYKDSTALLSKILASWS